jgi:hypothetical protein
VTRHPLERGVADDHVLVAGRMPVAQVGDREVDGSAEGGGPVDHLG